MIYNVYINTYNAILRESEVLKHPEFSFISNKNTLRFYLTSNNILWLFGDKPPFFAPLS